MSNFLACCLEQQAIFISVSISSGWRDRPGCVVRIGSGPGAGAPGHTGRGRPWAGSRTGPCERWIWRGRSAFRRSGRCRRFRSCKEPAPWRGLLSLLSWLYLLTIHHIRPEPGYALTDWVQPTIMEEISDLEEDQ